MAERITTKPFVSKRQQRWAFANKKPFARRWAHETDFASLPASKDDSAPLHGPGGLLAMPGMGARKKKRWGLRTKATQIRGNLYRGDTGQFQSGGAASATPQRGVQLSKQPTPKHPPVSAPKGSKGKKGGGKGGAAKPKKAAQTPAPRQAREPQRAQEHEDQQAQNRADVFKQMNIAPDGQQALEALRAGEQPDAAALARGGFEKAGLVEQARDGSYRLTASGRALMGAADAGDAGRAGASISSSRDRVGARQDRQAEQAQKRMARDAELAQRDAERAAAEKKRQSAGSGGGSSKQPSEPKIDRASERAVEREQQSAAAVEASGIGQQGLADLRQAAESGGVQNKQLASLGLIGADGMTTDQGRRALNALERGDTRQYQAAIQDARARQQREQQTQAHQRATQDRQIEKRAWAHYRPRTKAEEYGGIKRSNLDDSVFAGPDRSFPIKTAQDVRDAVASLGRTKHDKAAVKRGIIRRARAIGATDALPENWRGKAFTVFKDASGHYRWIARTTTAYRDRDGEILSVDALDRDSQRMMATKQFGPLRWWHVGSPNPLHARAPWGPGVDIGDCDYSVVIGRTRVESGTFRNPQIARKMARVADSQEMSPGFFHPVDQPGADGVFHQIRTFERSPVPIRYGRASNLFTGFAVKESRMDPIEMERRFKALITELQLAPEQAQELAAGLVQTEKTATAQGIAYKSEDTAPAPPEEIVIGSVTYTVKAAPPPPAAEAAPDIAVETQADGEIDMKPDGDEMDGDVVGNMSPAEFSALLSAAIGQAFEPLIKALDITGKMAGQVEELKGMFGGVATKDDARAQEIATLKAQQRELATKLAALEGDQPAVTLPAEVEAAFKSAGPAAPEQPDKPALPDRPFAGATAGLLPELYSTNDWQYGPNGWQPRTQVN